METSTDRNLKDLRSMIREHLDNSRLVESIKDQISKEDGISIKDKNIVLEVILRNLNMFWSCRIYLICPEDKNIDI